MALSKPLTIVLNEGNSSGSLLVSPSNTLKEAGYEQKGHEMVGVAVNHTEHVEKNPFAPTEVLPLCYPPAVQE